MREPSVRTSRLAIAGAAAATLAVGGAGFFLGRETMPRPEPERVEVRVPAPAPEPVEPDRTLALGRAEIIALTERASDAFASGESSPTEIADAEGRRFELLLPFGCDGPAGEASAAPMRWRYDEEEEALRLHVEPVRWEASDWRLGEGADIAAIEGFWITRPWSSSGRCPSRLGQEMATGMAPVTLPGQTLAVAQFVSGEARRGAGRDDPRENPREDRPYESVQRVPAGALDARAGFRVRLSGRIDSVPGGGPVRCIQPAGFQQRPICVVAVVLDELSIENPATDEVLATWPVRRTERTRG